MSVNSESTDLVCKICRRQFAKYTCPSCNMPYCCLTCFRSEAHGDCSESFYKKELTTQIHSEPSKTREEKQKMMEVLKRFEEESQQEEGEMYESDSDDDANILAKRLGDVDLDAVSPDDLWSMLSPVQQQKFVRAFRDPSSELVQQLLASETIEHEAQPPWWEDEPTNVQSIAMKTFIPIAIPSNMIKPLPAGPSLIYNIAAVLIAYTYITRYFAVSSLSNVSLDSPDLMDAKNLVAQLVPLLTNRKATTTFSSIEDAATDIYSRIGPDKVSKRALGIYANDAAQLLRPLQVILLDAPTDSEPTSPPSSNFDYSHHPHRIPVLALSDLHTLFTSRTTAELNSQHVNPTAKKIIFYAARVISLPSHLLHMVSEELLGYAELVRREDEDGGKGSDEPSGATSRGKILEMASGRGKPLVEELPK